MKRPVILFLILFFTCQVLFLSSCEKDELDKLPAITSEGLNTFGCLINGEAFKPKRRHWVDVPLGALYDRNNDVLKIVANNKVYDIGLKIYHPETNLTSHFEDSPIGNPNKTNIVVDCSGRLNTFQLDSLNMSFLSISKFDIEQQVVSGTFEILFVNDGVESCETEYILSEGRFDLVFDVY